MVMKALILICALVTVAAIAQDEVIDTARPDSAEQESTSGINDLSQAEIDAELERVEQALGVEEEVTEFTPSKPLPADLPVALPSDI